MERGDEALTDVAVITNDAVIARLDRAIQYSRASMSSLNASALEYWATRFRGW
jgi:hypothetical protein